MAMMTHSKGSWLPTDNWTRALAAPVLRLRAPGRRRQRRRFCRPVAIPADPASDAIVPPLCPPLPDPGERLPAAPLVGGRSCGDGPVGEPTRGLSHRPGADRLLRPG